MKILCVAAHPDDEVLGCGGTLMRLSRQGHAVYIAIMGEGITSRYANREEADQRLIKTLHETAKEVGSLLGAETVFQYSLPDNRFDTVPLLDIVKLVENLIEQVKPKVIYTHHGGDLNIDHVIVNRAVLTATRPMRGCSVREIYAFEVPSSTEWAFQRFAPVFQPNVFEDITETLGLKLQSLQLYEAEARPFPHPRSPEALRALAQRQGSIVGLEAAEAFELLRSIRQ